MYTSDSGSAIALAWDIQARNYLRSLIFITLVVFCHLICVFAVMAQIPGNDPSPAARQSGREGRPTTPSTSHQLELLKPIERELSRDEVHYYRLAVTEGYFVRIKVLQHGIDVVLTLRSPRDEKLLRVDSPNGTHGPEPLSYLSQTSGTYTVAIAPFNKKTLAGRYVVTLEEARLAVPQDSKRIEAERALAKGLELRNLTEGSKDSALAEYSRAVTLFREIGDHYFEGFTDQSLASAYFSIGRRKEALERFNNALQLFRKVKAPSAEAAVLNDIGRYYRTLGQNQVALRHHEDALTLFRQEKNTAGEAETLSHLGAVNYALGNYKKAIERFEEVVVLSKASYYETLEASALEGIGACHLALNKRSEARKFYKKALTIQRSSRNRFEEIRTLVNLVMISIWLDDEEELYNYYNLLQPPGRLEAESYIRLPKPDDLAVETYNKALSLSNASGNLFEVAGLLNDIGSIHLRMRNYERALDSFYSALLTNRRIQNLPGTGYTLDRLMNCWKLMGNSRLAIFYGKQAINVYQEMRRYIPETASEFQISFVKSKEITYRVLGDLLISQNRLFEAQQVLNLLKEEEFFQFVGGAADEAISLNSRASLTSTESRWAMHFENLADAANTAAKKRSEFWTLVHQGMEDKQRLGKFDAELKKSKRMLDNFIDQLRADAESRRAGTLDVGVPEAKILPDTLADLGTGVVALFTLVTEDRYSVLLVSPTTTKAYQYSIKKTVLAEKIADLLDVLRDPSSDPVPLAHEVYRILLGPVADELQKLKAKTLMWSLDGVLRTIPIAALHDGKQYLIERYEIAVFTPTSQRTLKDLPSASWNATGFGVSKEHGDLPDLPAVPDELDAVIKQLNANGEQSNVKDKIFIDEKFTEQSFFEALRSKSPVIHIASHFHFAEGNALDSFLLLGDGKHLSLRRIKEGRGLFVGVDLLTLSACDTATGGKDGNGKEVDGLAEFAQRQGAKAVIATLWQVDDYSTRELMQEFYAIKQSKGTTKAKALATAQLKLLSCTEQPAHISEADLAMQSYIEPDAEPECFSHPYYWAPFILMGNWR